MTTAGPQRRLAAVLAADIVGFSRLMGADEEGTLARLKSLRAAIIDPEIAAGNGRIFKTTGDGLLAEFASAVDAARPAARTRRRSLRWVGGLAIAGLASAALVVALSPELVSKARQAVFGVYGNEYDSDSRATIAVLPFANQSGDASRDYFSDGICEDIINALARFPGLSVISRNAVQACKGRSGATTRRWRKPTARSN